MGVRERSLWAAVEVSYGKAHEFLRKFTGLEVSRKKIHQMALEEGRRIEGWEEERRRVVFEEAKEVEGARKVPEVLYIQVDGTGVNDRASGQWMECKVEASFSERVKVSKDRVWLVDKKSYASIEGEECSFPDHREQNPRLAYRSLVCLNQKRYTQPHIPVPSS